MSLGCEGRFWEIRGSIRSEVMKMGLRDWQKPTYAALVLLGLLIKKFYIPSFIGMNPEISGFKNITFANINFVVLKASKR